MAKNLIKTEKILYMLEEEIVEVMSSDPEYYNDYGVIISPEQQFIKSSNRSAGKIYMVVKFSPASINFGQIVLPFTITAVSEKNGIEVCQKLMMEFAQSFNMYTYTDEETNYSIFQVYTTPSNSSNFNETFDGFRSVFAMTGTLLISKNANVCAVYYNGQEVPCISSNLNFNVKLDSQAFFNSQNFTESVGQVGTLALGINSYLTFADGSDENLFDKILNIITKNSTKAPDGINTTFEFKIVYKSGTVLNGVKMKLVSFSQQQNIGEIPLVSLTFTC